MRTRSLTLLFGLMAVVADASTLTVQMAAEAPLHADGQSVVQMIVKVSDAGSGDSDGDGRVVVAIDGARVQRATPCEAPRRCNDNELQLVNGEARFGVIAPTSARDVEVTVTAGQAHASTRLAFLPEQRPLMAVGLVEGVLHFGGGQSGGLGQMSGLSDAFEHQLRRWERSFDDGKGSIAARTAFFVKGTVRDDYSLKMMFDSERETRQRKFDAINPDRQYTVMGDSAQRGLEVTSADRFFLRVDKDRNYLMYGDFSTGAGFSMSSGAGRVAPLKKLDLGQYNRTMTGLRMRGENVAGYVDVFGMRDSLRQAVEEYRGNGTSGPFAVGNYSALENSEKVEVVVRDRSNTSRIVNVRMLERYEDYTFEPFSGRIVLKAPLPSVDDELNPVSLRITYEVDTGGDQFWVYGATAQRHLTPWLEIGGSLVKDENPGRPSGSGFATTPGTGFAQLGMLASANLTFGSSETNSLVIEGATSDATTAAADISGTALRFDLRLGRDALTAPAGRRWNARVYGGTADREFTNPSSSLAPGRTESGAQLQAELGARTDIDVRANLTEDDVSGGAQGGARISLGYRLSERVTLDFAARHFHRDHGGVASYSLFAPSAVLPDSGAAYGGAGLNPNGAGFWGMGVGLDAQTGQPQTAFNGSPLTSNLRAPDIDLTSASVGARVQVAEGWMMGAEVGQDHTADRDPSWVALNTDYRYRKARLFGRVESPTGRAVAGGDYRFSPSTALYGRWEESNGLGSAYALDDAAQSRAFVLGVRRTETGGGDVHGEMRMRDGMNDRDLEAVSGVRDTIAISDRVNANLFAERLEILRGTARSATALGGGLDFGDRGWQGTTRLEWRRIDRGAGPLASSEADSWMSTVSFARKLSDGWTGLIRNYLLTTDDRGKPGDQLQNRFQIGAAYRSPGTSRFDLLLRYENKAEHNDELLVRESRNVDILSANVNWHPVRTWWVEGRVAVKDLRETLAGVRDDYQAWLISGRLIHDIGARFDVGAIAGLMGTPNSNARESTYGLEAGYRVKENVWLSLGHNFAGFRDRDLAGREQTERGWYLRLRMKFDEKNFRTPKE